MLPKVNGSILNNAKLTDVTKSVTQHFLQATNSCKRNSSINKLKNLNWSNLVYLLWCVY